MKHVTDCRGTHFKPEGSDEVYWRCPMAGEAVVDASPNGECRLCNRTKKGVLEGTVPVRTVIVEEVFLASFDCWTPLKRSVVKEEKPQ